MTEFPVVGEHERQLESTDAFGLVHLPGMSHYLPPVHSAESHVVDNRLNYQFQTSLKRQEKREINGCSAVKQATTTGWVLPAPFASTIEITEDRVDEQADICEKMYDTSSDRVIADENGVEQRHEYYITLRLPWTITQSDPELDERITADDLVFLITGPLFYSPDYTEYDIVPQIVDFTVGPQTIPVTLRVVGTKSLEIKHGQPIAQLIPIRKDFVQAEAVVHWDRSAE